VQKLDTHGLPPQAFLGFAGMPGLTAYVGLLRIAELKDGDVVFVSGAAGAVGSVACQIAKLKGHTVIGSAGGPQKARFLKEIGVDHAIDYKAERDLTAALMRAAPSGIDVYFENVGGVHMEAALMAANNNARFALCGMISEYNNADLGSGVRALFLAVAKSLTLRGFIVSNHGDMQAAFVKDLAGWVAAGKIQSRETVKEGIENAPAAFLGLFKGDNLGKMLVRLN
jgi:NADPH-dependent curcumin reductase CurA